MITITRNRKQATSQRGGALLVSLIAVAVIAGMSSAYMSVTVHQKGESSTANNRMKALYVAEAGVSHGMANVAAGLTKDIGGVENPVGFSGGSYSVAIVDNGDDTFTLTSRASYGTDRRSIEVIVQSGGNGVFDNAIFAGNRDGDPTYTLEFGGSSRGHGNQADRINGDVYSGGDVDIVDDAQIRGTIRTAGTVVGGSGEEGVTLPIPDIPGMNYEVNHDVSVLGEFITGGSYWSGDALGGSAWQLPEANPAHIFRANPSDRASDVNSTEKNDFFLEDPYENVHVDSNSNGSDATTITLSGGSVKPGPDGNGIVYFIDGNLWVHNKRTYSFKIDQIGGSLGVQVTFVVKGNIYFSDNLFLQNKNKDGIAFIAMDDENVDDSGNIYFGDPSFGTLEQMDAFMYAENNFYDSNLDAAGSSEVTVNGNMSAGNHVAINRDWGTQHSKLTVNFDDRISTGAITLPGLPDDSGGGGAVTTLSWREVALP